MKTGEPMQWRGQTVAPGAGPFVVGILNVTPDSFSDGGAYPAVEDAVAAGWRMAEEGADAIDVGGESSRPGSLPVPAEEQIRRTRGVIAALAARFSELEPCLRPAISIDTRSSIVAEVALDAGATIINDISALRDDPAMSALAAKRGAGVVLMHMKGAPADMQRDPRYDDVVAEVRGFLAERIAHAECAGIPANRILIDPGIGFGKTTAHNLALLRQIAEFRTLGRPVLVGPSRKRFIGEILGRPVLVSPSPKRFTGEILDTTERTAGTAAAVAACILAGIECVRVHDVLPCRQTADLCAAIRSASLG